MKRVLGLALAGLGCTPLAALAQDSLPAGDIAIFSTFHARLAAYEDVSRWVAERLPGRGERGWANRVANSGRHGREWVVKFLGKYGAQVHPVEGDSLTLAATSMRRELEALQGRALDSAWARQMRLWLDEARVRAIFVESKQLQHKKARGVESNLRGAWGNGYHYACHVRSRYERTGLDGRGIAVCGVPALVASPIGGARRARAARQRLDVGGRSGSVERYSPASRCSRYETRRWWGSVCTTTSGCSRGSVPSESGWPGEHGDGLPAGGDSRSGGVGDGGSAGEGDHAAPGEYAAGVVW